MQENNENKLYNIRHSLAHILAQAILTKYPEALISTGPVVENGFYYDIDFLDKVFTEKDFGEIEKEMQKIISKNLSFNKKVVSEEEAKEFFKNNPYKLDIIQELAKNNETITFYTTGEEFTDLCRGGHVENTKEINVDSFKLEKIAGAYFKADANNKQLTRIYGLAFETKTELENFIWQQEEAKKRDHRILGKHLKIYTISDLIGSGLPLFHKNGQILRREITEYLWSLHKDYNYEWVTTPHIAKESLFETSGHSKHYLEDMFSVFGGTSKEKFYVKPMSCPMHMELFKDNQFSYKNMPQRYFEPAVVYRDEKTGQLSGLTRVRSITQDDGHIFCRQSGIKTEIKIMIDILKKFYTTMGMIDSYEVSLSTRDLSKKETFLGGDEIWETAENALKEICKEENLPFYESPGDAAFYGPKLDFMFKDAIGRKWQLATIQCDFNLPKRFELSFVNEKGEDEQPVVIHRAISGSLERFIGVAIEHFAGAFPVWLSPVQVCVVYVKEDLHKEYAEKVFDILKENNIRAEFDDRNESMGKKIRTAKEMKIPYIIVIGDKEKESNNLTIETRTEKIENISVLEFVEKINQEIKNRTL